MTNQAITVAVTGAAGQIGYALLFRIASGQMFGPKTPVRLNLVEIEPGLPALRGVAMELDDCAFPLLQSIQTTADLREGFKDINWAIQVGAAPRKAGMERADLLKMNGGIFAEQGKALNDYAANDVRIFVVGNPCNTNCLIAMHHAPDIPRDRFFAMTSLDELRARTQLAKKAGVPVTDVSQMVIWGNHSSTQFPDFAHASIAGKPVPAVITDTAWLQETFIPTVQKRGAAVIEARGASSAASAANAVVYGIYNLTHDTPAGETFSVAKYATGEYGVDEGLIFSFPSRTEAGKLQVVHGWEHDAFGQEKFNATLNELRQEKQTVSELGLI